MAIDPVIDVITSLGLSRARILARYWCPHREAVGEHPNWDEFRNAMVTDRRLAVRLRPERAYGMVSES